MAIASESQIWRDKAKSLRIEDEDAHAVARFTFLYIALVVFAKWNNLMGERSFRDGSIKQIEVDSQEFMKHYGPKYESLDYQNSWYKEQIRVASLLTPRLISIGRGHPINLSIDRFDTHVVFLNTIRNNLFHGGKTPSDPRDKRFLDLGSNMIDAMFDEILLKEN